jgi:4-hydroxybenzoate polyprenyltransferase
MTEITRRPLQLITLLRLGRVSNLPTVCSNVLAGTVLAGANWSDWRFVTVLVAMILFYVGGMYLNDYFDRAIDAQERPGRPIPSGAMSATAVAAIGFGSLAAGVLASATTGASASVFALLLAAAIVTYDLFHKGNPFGPTVMGVCRALVYSVAATALGATTLAAVTVPAVAIGAFVAGLSYAARQESLDKITNLWPLLLLAAPAVVTFSAWQQGVAAIAIWLLMVVWSGAAVYLLARRPVAGAVPLAVGWLIAGVSLCDAAMMASIGAVAPAVTAVACFLATLLAQKYIAGT